ncbi:MAG: hypothetical protein JZU49_01325, partial [Sulfuricurvum sp.]|nr:hypothetical protein [Sulfuricurvum sp.]
NSGMITDIANCSATDTVIVAIKPKRQRKQIVDSLTQLGDRVVDYYSQNQLYSIADFWAIPHRLMVLHYKDYHENKKAIIQHLANSNGIAITPILVIGRLWRKLPRNPSIIDGDNTSPEDVYRMFLEARGKSITVDWRLV